MHSGSFWNILLAFCNILDHSTCILENSGTFCLHSGTFCLHSGTFCMHCGTLYCLVLSCTVLYCLVLSCTDSVCVHSLELQVDHKQTDRQTEDIRTCRAASSQPKSGNLPTRIQAPPPKNGKAFFLIWYMVSKKHFCAKKFCLTFPYFFMDPSLRFYNSTLFWLAYSWTAVIFINC